MLVFPHCKINIGLYITNRRKDGYHDIETVFYPIPLYDALEAVPANETKLHTSGLEIPGTNDDNLVWRAYQLLKKKIPQQVPKLDIYLHKAIHTGAGLGGGSADGAFMLRLLNTYCNLSLTGTELKILASELGSDCAFFTQDKPQYATGRGEIMEVTSINLSGYSVQLVCPDIHVSTAAAFGMIQPRAARFDLRKLPELPLEKWKEHIGNDFENHVFEQYPVLKEIKKQLYEQGAVYAAMSGSGSAVFGIFEKGKKANININIESKTVYVDI